VKFKEKKVKIAGEMVKTARWTDGAILGLVD
jgi:hypothetical protein